MITVVLAVVAQLLKPGVAETQSAVLPADKFHTTITTDKCRSTFEETHDDGAVRRFTIDWTRVTSVSASKGEECAAGQACEVQSAPTVVIWGTPGALKGEPGSERLVDT